MVLSESEQWLVDEICAYVSDLTRRYAISIEGPWGSGKTRFLNFALAPGLKKMRKRMVRVSMFGLKDGDELYEKLGAVLLHLQGERDGKLAKLTRKAIATTPKFVGSALSRSGISLQLDLGMKFVVDMLASNKHVIVLDDVERRSEASDDLSLFGAVNELVEGCGLKVVLVANRLQLSGDKGRLFDSNVREKLVWKRYAFAQPFDALAQGIFGEIVSPIRGIDVAECVSEALERSECVNARAMLKTELMVRDLLQLDVFSDESIYLENRRSAFVDIVQFALMVCDERPPRPPVKSGEKRDIGIMDADMWRQQQQYEFYCDARFIEWYFSPSLDSFGMNLEDGVKQYVRKRYPQTQGTQEILRIKSLLSERFREMSDSDVSVLAEDLSSQIRKGAFTPVLIRDVVYWNMEFNKLGFASVLPRDELVDCCKRVLALDVEGGLDFSKVNASGFSYGEPIDSILNDLAEYAVNLYKQQFSHEVDMCVRSIDPAFDFITLVSESSMNAYELLTLIPPECFVRIFIKSDGGGQCNMLHFLVRVDRECSIPAGVEMNFRAWLISLRESLGRSECAARMDRLRTGWLIGKIDELLQARSQVSE